MTKHQFALRERNHGMSRNHIRLDRTHWARTRRTVFQRDGWRCIKCGLAGRLECDHIVALEDDPEQDWYAVEGCQTLCRSCHVTKTRRERRARHPLPADAAAWAAFVEEIIA